MERLTCREFVTFLSAYLAGELPSDTVARFNAHLTSCPPCASYVRSFTMTSELARAAIRFPEDEVPEDLPEDLVKAIVAERRPT
jgi:anti-sigma factor RsiW